MAATLLADEGIKNYLLKEKEKLSLPGALDKKLIDALLKENKIAVI